MTGPEDDGVGERAPHGGVDGEHTVHALHLAERDDGVARPRVVVAVDPFEPVVQRHQAPFEQLDEHSRRAVVQRGQWGRPCRRDRFPRKEVGSRERGARPVGAGVLGREDGREPSSRPDPRVIGRDDVAADRERHEHIRSGDGRSHSALDGDVVEQADRSQSDRDGGSDAHGDGVARDARPHRSVRRRRLRREVGRERSTRVRDRRGEDGVGIVVDLDGLARRRGGDRPRKDDGVSDHDLRRRGRERDRRRVRASGRQGQREQQQDGQDRREGLPHRSQTLLPPMYVRRTGSCPGR